MESDAALAKAEYIDRYLKGELSPAEQTTFRQRVQEDPAFAGEVEQAQSVRSLIRHYGLRQDVASIHRQAMAERRGSSRLTGWNTPLRVAATLTLLLVFALVIRLYTLSGDSLAGAYEPYAADVTRGEDNRPYDISRRLLEEYAHGNYHAVVRLFQQYDVETPREIFIVANAYLSLSQPDKAIPLLQRVMADSSESGNFTFLQDAEYYLAWAYLKNNQLPEADRLFTAIYDNPHHPYNPNIDGWFYWKIKLLRLKKGV